jgi:hypothetical protein
MVLFEVVILSFGAEEDVEIVPEFFKILPIIIAILHLDDW